jgi:hypothetical protein
MKFILIFFFIYNCCAFTPNLFYPKVNNLQNKELPAIIFLSGLNTNIPNFFYSKFINTLSSNALVITINNKLVHPNNFIKTSENIQFISNWCRNDLNNYLKKINCNYSFNNNLILSAHSCSCQSIIYAIKNNIDVNSCILVDPVDGSNLNSKNIQVIDSNNKLITDKNILIICNSLSNQKPLNFKFYPECVPDQIGYKHFYNNIHAKTKILVKADNYGHIDFLNDNIIYLADIFKICKTIETNNKNSNILYKSYRKYLCELIINFTNYNYTNLNNPIFKIYESNSNNI